MRRSAPALALLAAVLLWPGPAYASRPAVCMLPIADARPVRSPTSVPYRVKAENTPEPIRAHPPKGPSAVRRAVLRALASEPAIELVDLAGADLARLSSDPRVRRCALLVGGALFHYEGIVAVDIYGSKLYTAIVGFELVAAEPREGRPAFAPVAFAGRRQSEPVKTDDDTDRSDRAVLAEWIDEALKVASASLQARFTRPAAAAALNMQGR